jgi:drug/metabolite transporter (DMT)-like permease
MKKDWVLFALPGVIWGASFLFIAEGLEAVGPYGVAFVRLLVGFAALAAFPAARRSIGGSAWLGIAAVGLTWMAFPLTMFPLAEQRVNTAITGMLNGAVPFFATIVAVLISRRAPARHILVGLAVGLAGSLMIALPTANAGASSLIGVLMILAAVTSYGIAINIARPLQQTYGALPVIWRAQAVALVLTAPLGIPDVLNATWSFWPVVSLLALGALGTGVAFVLTATVAGRMGAPVASAIAFLIPPVALLLGVLVRGERVALISALGSAVCIAGAIIMQRKPPHAQNQLRQAEPRPVRRDGSARPIPAGLRRRSKPAAADQATRIAG